MTTLEVDLRLTGQRLEDQHLVEARGKSIWITSGSLRVLATLVAAQGRYVANSAVTYPVAVCRLRHALGHPRGRMLIETGAGREYRLRPGTTVAVDRALVDCLERTDPPLAAALREADVEWIEDEEPGRARLQLAA
jgi:hypothetical protein